MLPDVLVRTSVPGVLSRCRYRDSLRRERDYIDRVCGALRRSAGKIRRAARALPKLGILAQNGKPGEDAASGPRIAQLTQPREF